MNPGGTGGCFATIQAAADAAANYDVIDIAAGTYAETVTINSDSPAPRLTLQGAGVGATIIDGQANSTPVITADGTPVNLILTGVTLTNGRGLSVLDGRAEVTNVEVSNSIAYGIYFVRANGKLTNSSVVGSGDTGVVVFRSRAEIVGSTIAQSAFGGLSVDSSRVAIDGTTIENNTLGGFGGGIRTNESRLTITNSTVRGNSAYTGAGIHVYRSRVVVSGTTFSGNTAESNGGAASVHFGQPGLLRLTNCTVSGNQADSGGAFNAGGRGRLLLSSSTVSGNTAVTGTGGIAWPYGLTPVLANSILANNVGPGANDCSGELSNRAYNLIEDPSGCDLVGAGVGDIYGVDPLLGPLAANGGPTETHALLAGSPAIATTSGRHCPATDQRGNPRPIPCDVGAYQTP